MQQVTDPIVDVTVSSSLVADMRLWAESRGVPMAAIIREWRWPATVTVALLVVSFLLHAKFCGTPMHMSEEDWQGVLTYHLRTYPFSMRWLTSYPVLFCHDALDFPVRETFFTLQFSLACCLGLLFYRYLRRLSFAPSWSVAGVALLLSAYPVLCAHFEPVHTWDDFWVYLFLILSTGALLRRHQGAGSLLFMLACFAREQTLLFYPAFLFVSFSTGRGGKLSGKIAWLLLPAVVYGTFYAIVWENPDPQRYALLRFNFATPLRSSDTLYSLFISFGFLWLAAAAGFIRNRKQRAYEYARILFFGALLTVPITVIFTLCFTLARETRLFFPPFLFVIPLALLELSHLREEFRGMSRSALRGRILAAAVLMGIGFSLGLILFPNFEYRNCPNFARGWAGIQLGLSLILVSYYLWSWRIRRLGDRPVRPQ